MYKTIGEEVVDTRFGEPTRGWGYEIFTAGSISSTSATLSGNDNGTGASFNASKIIASSAKIVRHDNPHRYAYTGTSKLISTKVKVTAHTGASVTLSGVPHSSWGDLRIMYKYEY